MNFSKLERTIFINLCLNDTKNLVDALSKMTKRDVKITSYSFRRIVANKIPKFLNPKEISFLLVYNKIFGGLKGVIAVGGSLIDFLKLVDILLHKKIGYYKALDDENLPVIKELVDILNGYYLSSISKIFEDEIKWEFPYISTNPYRAIEEFDFGPIYIEKIYIMMFKTNIEIEEDRIDFQTLLFFNEEDVRKILDRLAQKISV